MQTAIAKSSALRVAGYVPLRAEILINYSPGRSNPTIESKSSKELSVKVQQRGLASVVEVSAP